MLEGTISDVDTLRWYLTLTTPSEKHTDSHSDLNIATAFGRLLADSTLIFPRIAHSFRVEGGEQSDPEAGTDLCGPATGSVRLGADGTARVPIDEEHVLLLDAGAGTIALARGDRVVPIWGQERESGQGGSRHQFHETMRAELANGTGIAIETAPAPDHPDAVSPTLITVTRAGASVSLYPEA